MSSNFGFRLTFRRLRASASPRIASSAIQAWKADWFPAACPNFENRRGVGHCNGFGGVCKVWECSGREMCGEQCAKNCVVLKPDNEVIREPPPELRVSLEILRQLQDRVVATSRAEDIVTPLLAFAEESACLGLSGRPMEILAAARIHEWLFERYGDLRRFPLPRGRVNLTRESELLWKLILTEWLTAELLTKLTAGDALLLVRPKGRGLIERLAQDPLALLDDFLLSLEGADEDQFGDTANWKLLWSEQMEPVIGWCLKNGYPVDFTRASLDEELKAV